MSSNLLQSLALVGLFAGVIHAQTNLTVLRGTVQDPSGAAIQGASIVIEDLAQGAKRTGTSDGEGLFAFTNLNPRTYVVSASKEGFQTWHSEQIPLIGGDVKVVTIVLPVGSIQDQVTVTAPLTDLSPGLGTNIDRIQVTNLPLNGRTFQALITLTPGVVSAPASFETQGQFSVNGQRTSANYFTIDGVSANFSMSSAVRPGQTAAGALPALSVAGTTAALLPLEAMQEFRIQTSAYAAEYGRQPGAQIQITSLSGGNSFHGTMYDFFRNDKLDAADWFANRNRLAKPPLRQNNFGGVVSGPVIRNRTFFTATYEGLRLRQPKVATVPVANLATRTQVPAALRPFVDAIAVPNGAELGSGLAEFNASYSDPTTLNATSIKIDQAIGSKVFLFGRYNHSTSELGTRQTSGFAPNTQQIDKNRIWTLTFGATAILTPNWTSDSRFNASFMEAATREQVDGFGGAVPVPASALYPSFTNRDESAFFFQLTQGVGFVDGNISRNRQKQLNWVQGINWSTARHAVKFGADFRWLLPSVSTRDFDTFYRFANSAGLVSGVATTAGVRGFPVVDFAYSNYSLFAQDQWRVNPALTISYGLRWEMNPGPTGRNGYSLYPIVGSFPNFTVGSPDNPFYETTKNNFAPRIGIAWQPHSRPGRDMVVRSGFGVFYDLGAGMSGSLSDNLYTRARQSANVTFPLASSVLQPIPPPASPPFATVTGTDPNLKLPYSYHWNVTVEQSLGLAQALSVGYLGSKGNRLLQTQFFLNPNPTFQQLRFIKNTAESRYHALQARLQRRMTTGVQALVSYTWSHSIDNTSGDDTVFSPPIILNSSLDRGSSDFDARHTFTVGFTWEPRVNGRPMTSHLVNGWGLDFIWRTQSALPVNPFETRVFPGLSGSIQTRPDLIAGVPLYLESSGFPGGRAINLAAFQRITEARQGNLGRNSLRAFALNQLDLTLRRTFTVTERVRLQLRAEAYNLANHPNFAAPTADVTNPLFGISQRNYGAGLGSGGINAGLSPLYQVGTPRSLQLALKLQF